LIRREGRAGQSFPDGESDAGAGPAVRFAIVLFIIRAVGNLLIDDFRLFEL
jgi:hypothetical protein